MNINNLKDFQIKNVVLISFDSLRSDYITNLKSINAPHFCMMRDEGAFFKNTIVQAPMTVPSHCSMLTGFYPVRTGVRDMHHQLPSEIASIFNILQKKHILTFSLATTPMLKNRGFTGIDFHLPLSPKHLAKVIKKNKKSQFFAFFHYWNTHTPYETNLPTKRLKDRLLNVLKPLKNYKNLPGIGRINEKLELQRVEKIRFLMKKGDSSILKAVKQGYLNSIYVADKFLGSIYKTIDELGLAENTLFILMGDHGDSFNEHNEVQRQPDGRYEHGHFLYDNIIKVPLIFYTKNAAYQKVIEEQTELIDVTPTIIEAFNAEYNGQFDGNSLWQVITSWDAKYQRQYVKSEVVRESRQLSLISVRTSKSKLIRDDKLGEYEYYDLINDTGEEKNIWPDDPHHEKKNILSELEAYAAIESKKIETPLEEDKKKIEKALRDLGYM
jgi:arylsulfatase A-like enzyme